jgi:TonB-dependent receptor
MIKRFTTVMGEVLLFLQLLSVAIFPSSNGTIKGTIKDAQTKEALPYSNVTVLGTSWGASSNVEGNFVIQNIPAGKYTLRASYIGYKSQELVVEVTDGNVTRKNFNLKAEGVYSDSVVVTAQAEGQTKAINEQLNSVDIKNVVSAAKLQELPDANAAESVSRLPGVSIIRTGGEGAQVVIRGLSPQYNQITIDGVELPSNVASSNNITSGDRNLQTSMNTLGDRGEDLSMISSSMLGGIEVIKAITPDMDATLIGGVVNFDMRKASKRKITDETNQSYLPEFTFTLQGGYNDLKNKTNDYKLVGQAEERFFNDKLGVFVQASAEQRNLSANQLSATYDLNADKLQDVSTGIPITSNVSIADVYRLRQRYGGTVVLDYQHQTGSIGLMNFISTSDTKAITRSETVTPSSNEMYFNAEEKHNKLSSYSNLLSIKQDISSFHFDVKLSHSYSESKDPEDLYFNFYEQQAGLYNKIGQYASPKQIMSSITPNDSNASLDQIKTSSSQNTEKTYNATIDIKSNITVSDFISGSIKFGGSYQYRDRTYNYDESSGSQLYSGGSGVVTAILKAYPGLSSNGGLSLASFAHDSYSYGTFLNGDYKLAYPINVGLMWALLPFAKKTSTLEGYRKNNLASLLNDYTGNETKSALYSMFTVNLGDQISIIPGARYQNLATSYTGMRGEQIPNGIQGGDTTVTQSHGYVLPMVHVIYKPLNFLQFHFAYTNTLNYPDYSTITPRYYVGANFVDYNNYQLKPARSENFDFVTSLYSNEVGLLSVSLFTKNIKDLIFAFKDYITDLSAYPDLPAKKGTLYYFYTYINNPNKVNVYGIETEWQTHFWYLPQPFNNIVLDVNYTHIFSEASYPKTVSNTVYNEDGTAVTTYDKTTYKTRLINQPNDILNLAIGYDLGGFSARVSMVYQDNIFKNPDFWPQLRTISDKFTRWDLSIKQDLPWYDVQVYFDMNNITGSKETDLNPKTSLPAAETSYGMMSDLGIRVKL